MTLHWATCFSALLPVVLGAATVSGSVELPDSHDPGVRKKRDFSGVVLWLDPLSGAPPALDVSKHARMVQKDKTFTPHVLAIEVGTTVDFPNFDPIFHNAFSNYNGQVFDIGLYPPGSTRSIRFARAGIVRVFCNIHANMSAVIAVLSTPWFAVTAKDGAWSIPAVPPGDYTLRLFHERATAATLDRLSRRVTVRGEDPVIPPIAISESGYLSIPHKNKYGKDYPAAPSTDSTYPSVRP
jgi:plastocyanin